MTSFMKNNTYIDNIIQQVSGVIQTDPCTFMFAMQDMFSFGEERFKSYKDDIFTLYSEISSVLESTQAIPTNPFGEDILEGWLSHVQYSKLIDPIRMKNFPEKPDSFNFSVSLTRRGSFVVFEVSFVLLVTQDNHPAYVFPISSCNIPMTVHKGAAQAI